MKDKMTRTTGDYTDKSNVHKGLTIQLKKISTMHISQDSFTHLSIYQKFTTDL